MNKRTILIIGVVVILTAVFLFARSDEKKLEVIFFDVGQGDSALIKTPFGQDILIDGGPDNSVLEKLGANLGFFNNDIELMISTHPHADHVGGLIEIIRRYDVEKILYTGVAYDSLIYKTFLKEVEAEGAEIIIAKQRQKIYMGEDLYLDILYPEENITNEVHKNVNNTSIVFRLVYGENSFLFMGDAERDVENKIVDDGGLQSDVLKLAHHGSKTNDREFLDIVLPEFTVISVGKDNRFGHPNRGIINMLNNIASDIFRTDKLGDIYFFSDGDNLEVLY